MTRYDTSKVTTVLLHEIELPHEDPLQVLTRHLHTAFYAGRLDAIDKFRHDAYLLRQRMDAREQRFGSSMQRNWQGRPASEDVRESTERMIATVATDYQNPNAGSAAQALLADMQTNTRAQIFPKVREQLQTAYNAGAQWP